MTARRWAEVRAEANLDEEAIASIRRGLEDSAAGRVTPMSFASITVWPETIDRCTAVSLQIMRTRDAR